MAYKAFRGPHACPKGRAWVRLCSPSGLTRRIPLGCFQFQVDEYARFYEMYSCVARAEGRSLTSTSKLSSTYH